MCRFASMTPPWHNNSIAATTVVHGVTRCDVLANAPERRLRVVGGAVQQNRPQGHAVITSTPVGEWTWELTTDGGEIRPTRAAQTAVAVWNELAERDLAVPGGKATVRVCNRNDPRDVRVDASGLRTGTAPLAPGSALAQAVAQAEALDGDFIVVVRLECPGLWLEPGFTYRAEKLFAIHLEVWGGNLLVVTLETYSDAWLTMDTRDREQPEVYAANAPRLAAALQGISTLLDTARQCARTGRREPSRGTERDWFQGPAERRSRLRRFLGDVRRAQPGKPAGLPHSAGRGRL